MSSHGRPQLIFATIVVVFLTFSWIPTAHSQSITPVGSAETFDVATWNIEWFGNTGSGNGPSDVDQQRENVEKVIRESGIDLWALQEISDTRQFQELLDSLGGPWDGILASTLVTQRIAFIFNTDVVFLRQSKHILESFSTSTNQPLNYFAGRPPLQIKFDVILPDTTVELRVITLHMKCCTRQLSDYERRAKASERLKIHIEFSVLLNEPIAVVLGDFNDELSQSIFPGRPSPYENFLSNPNDYFFSTQTLDQQNENTFCSNSTCSSGSTLDHILITNELIPYYVDNSTARMVSVITAFPDFPGYVNSTSDHMPVYARFIFPTNTGTDRADEIPTRLRISNLYPNPTVDQLEFTVKTVTFEALLVEVYDVLGRKQSSVHVWPDRLAETRIRVDTRSLPAGIYFVRVSTGSLSSQAKFVKLAR